ncbi:hypothetical protein [Rhodovulum marinum]|uniref:Uncharacterized protein n=1 Tax=Rhodovulum marinum TaxID=320662 RepID=A0A4R2PYZ7_9RHOB|nr:hypothetical protein [Rhodovulum marinum]TCP40584.1 hypothetical protein EV662_107195 [Rhodovulum marinum]
MAVLAILIAALIACAIALVALAVALSIAVTALISGAVSNSIGETSRGLFSVDSLRVLLVSLVLAAIFTVSTELYNHTVVGSFLLTPDGYQYPPYAHYNTGDEVFSQSFHLNVYFIAESVAVLTSAFFLTIWSAAFSDNTKVKMALRLAAFAILTYFTFTSWAFPPWRESDMYLLLGVDHLFLGKLLAEMTVSIDFVFWATFFLTLAPIAVAVVIILGKEAQISRFLMASMVGFSMIAVELMAVVLWVGMRFHA